MIFPKAGTGGRGEEKDAAAAVRQQSKGGPER